MSHGYGHRTDSFSGLDNMADIRQVTFSIAFLKRMF